MPVKIWFSVMGLCCLVLATWLLLRRLRARLAGAVATGTITGHEAREDDGAVFHLPVVRFVDGAGKPHQFTSVAGGTARAPVPGTKVTVHYLPADPSVAYLAGFLHLWAAPLALFVLGAAGVSALYLP